jgi:peptidoglycan/xylan/chitin deacetylase (PgdA/CDA1 family)
MAEWPLGNRAALSLSFDNLGEAAEAQLGAVPMPEGPFGDHFTAREVVPYLLGEIGGRGLRATFFVEGINAELYPDVLMTIALRRHEVGYHAWCHEDWASLSAAEQADNLERGLAALDGMSMGTTGMRPPGGRLGAGGLDAIRAAGFGYCSPAGDGLSHADGLAVVPFQWQHVDASCVLPPLAAVRERVTGSPDPIEPAAFVEHVSGEIDRVAREGGHLTIVLHLAMVEQWLGRELLGALLDRVDEAAKFEDVWVTPCAKIAEHVLANPERFGGVTVLDETSWSDAAA